MSLQNIDAQLFLNAFNTKIWKNTEKIDFLKRNIVQIEDVVKKYLEGITDDFPYLTDHSLTHSRMLWNYANIIIGDKKNYLNPMEAFVLHIAFLIHDSGMCYSILNNKEEVEKDPFYKDFLKLHNKAGDNEDALFYTVRQRHGEYALRVATSKLREDEYLIQDTNLREELGLLIGKIAKSHTCNVNYIEREFGAKYCNPNFPTNWAIDCQKLSFILRVSDAAHLDNLRTPKSLKVISEIKGESAQHWTFQKKLGFPQLSDDNLLVYSTNSPFTQSQQKAWWFCYDALLVLDKELRTANEYFETKKQESFTAKGVKSINNTLELGTKYIRTENWKALDTRIKVSNPVHIASELGGVKLDGNIAIGLRELVQNSIDAINAYRFHTGQDNSNVGEIKLAIEQTNGNYYLTIADNGIGMSQTLLTNELLDFGGSYWKSNKFNLDFPGLSSQGFESIGKFGIGFFSVFMLGQEITVTSWKFGESIDNMKTLDFYNGLLSNPVLRDPNKAERNSVIDRGTAIRIRLNHDPFSQEGFLREFNFIPNPLYSIVKYFIPAPSVKVTTSEIDGNINFINPDFLENTSYSQIVNYFRKPNKHSLEEFDVEENTTFEVLKQLPLELTEIKDDEVYGKLVLLPRIGRIGISSLCLVLSNGIRVKEISGFIGYILTKEVVSLKRDEFRPSFSYEALYEWAKNQKAIIEKNEYISMYGYSFYSLLISFNLFDESLPLLLEKKANSYRYIQILELRNYLKEHSILKIHMENMYNKEESCEGYIFINQSHSVEELIKIEDKNRLTSYGDLIEKVIKEEWGSFEKTDSLSSYFSFDKPYTRIDIYKRT